MKYEHLEGLGCNLRYTLNKSETDFQFNRTVYKDKYSNINHDMIITRETCWNVTFMEPCIVNVFSSTTNKMQCYTIIFIVVSALHVSSSVSAHHQELKNFSGSIGYLSNLFAATAKVFELLMMSGNTARNM